MPSGRVSSSRRRPSRVRGDGHPSRPMRTPPRSAARFTDLPTCMMALRSWARDEGFDNPQLSTAIRAAGFGPPQKAIFRRGFGELLMVLPVLTPTTVVEAELEAAAL